MLSTTAVHRPPLSASDAAAYLGLSLRHVHALRAREAIPYLKLGRLVRYDPAELDAWVDARRHGEAGTS